MILLDDPRSFDRLDVSGMRYHLRNLPQQCRQAWAEGISFTLPPDYSRVDKVVVLGMGGSAIGGELLRALFSQKSRSVLWSHRDYGVPGFVDDRTLLIASSYSGTTEETLDGFAQAAQLGCKRLAITTGGTLKRLAEEQGVPVFTFQHHSPPRAAVGYSLIPLLVILRKLRLIPDQTEAVEEMFGVLDSLCARLAESIPLAQNKAKSLASRLHQRMPVIYGAGILSPVAYRWKTQLNENSKTWALAEAIPELNHNSIAGYAHPEEVKVRASVVMLNASTLHKQHQSRYIATGELLDRSGIARTTVNAEGHNELSQVMSLVLLGDWTSYYLAILNGQDPTPVPSIDYLKDRLKEL